MMLHSACVYFSCIRSIRLLGLQHTFWILMISFSSFYSFVSQFCFFSWSMLEGLLRRYASWDLWWSDVGKSASTHVMACSYALFEKRKAKAWARDARARSCIWQIVWCYIKDCINEELEAMKASVLPFVMCKRVNWLWKQQNQDPTTVVCGRHWSLS